MISAITSGLTSVIGWIGSVVTALTSSTGALKELLPLVGIGIAISAVMLGIRVIRSFTWGA